MSNANLNNPHTIMLEIGDISADAVTTVIGMTTQRKMRIVDAKIMNNASLAGDDTNHVALALKEKGGNDIATYANDVASGGIVQGEGKAMTMTSTDADRVKAAGSNLEIAITHPGTGQALTGAKVQVTGYYV